MFLCIARRFCTKPISTMRILNVAEKNDAAKSLANIMSRGGFKKREGFSKFNKIYEFDFNILGQNSTMTMTSVSGHLLGLEFTGQYKNWRSCNPVSLFDANVFKYCPDNLKDIKRTLEREIRGCESLIIWTDGDREGENIGFEIIQVCQAVKPNIKVFRAKFSEITHQAVGRACANLQKPDKHTSDAVDVRQELDLRIGAAFTRFQTLRLQKTFPNVLSEQLISYGSCQFPTLGFVVERYKQVQDFIPEPFWKIKVSHESEDGSLEFSWKRVRLFDHLACLVLYQHCLEEPWARVVNVRSKPKSKWRPQALDTVELEKLASRKLKISAKETMKIAEKLYTQGFISYPRTETNIFPKDLDLRGLVQNQVADSNWGEFASQLIQDGINPRNGNKTDKAHPPIHPIKYAPSLQGNELRLYEFIVRHFLACCSKDAQGLETTVEIEIAEEKFTAQGLMIIARNYLDVYPYENWNAKIIPVYDRGQTFQPTALEMNQGETSPPPLLTEADLITLMDKHGIGTDATHAEHIETIKARMYVGVRPDGKFVPGELGMGLVEGYDAMGYEMSKPHLRAELEADLKRICDGQKDKDDVLQEQIIKYRQVFVMASEKATKIDEALSQYFGDAAIITGPDTAAMGIAIPVKKCAQCGQDMILRTKKNGASHFLSCLGYPDCKAAIWFPDSVIEASVSEQTCDICQPEPVKKINFTFKKGSVPMYIPLKYEGCIGGCDRDLQEVLNIKSASKYSSLDKYTPNRRGAKQSLQQPPPSSFHDNGLLSDVCKNSRNNSKSRSFTTSLPQTRNKGIQDNDGKKCISSKPSMLDRPRRPAMSNENNGDTTSFGSGFSDRGANEFVCTCGEDAKLLTVRKEGPNQGRQFYVCPKPQDSKCSFFIWADESPDTNAGGSVSFGGNIGLQGTRYSSVILDRSNNDNGSCGVRCQCGVEAKLLIVRKDGPNKGRHFYTCPKPRGEGCSFFQWEDDPEKGGTDVPMTRQNTSFNNFRAQNTNIGREHRNIVCDCGSKAKLCTVQKEGQNKGRQFYTCTKTREGCGFFQWTDEYRGEGHTEIYKTSTPSKRFGVINRTGFVDPGSRRKRKCGLCGMEGHTRKKCPQS